ncbi:hypothetical protein [Streptomyces sp. A30]|uniref:hypothetical protein n=1 Tax=Streptomyces sp. A30 TaxID=2789273 RepID=UPI003980A0B6
MIEISRSLNRYRWQPTDEEVKYGADFFQLVQSMEEKEHGFPRVTEPWTPRLHTENVAVLADEVTMMRDEFLPEWLERLPADSPMAELGDMYVRAAQPVVQHVNDVLAAWRTATLSEPTDDEIAYCARYLGTPTEDVAARLRYESAARWEEERSTMIAAVSRDVEH